MDKHTLTLLPLHFEAEITITATPTLISELVADQLTALQIDVSKMLYAYLEPKVTAGTDRGAVRIGSASDTMFIHRAAGQLAAPPIVGDWYVERVGGTNVPATVVVGWQP